MKKITMYQILFFFLFSMLPIYGQYNPCYDELYLDLKAGGINSMTTREYHYFTRKDEECAEYNTFDKKYYDQTIMRLEFKGVIEEKKIFNGDLYSGPWYKCK